MYLTLTKPWRASVVGYWRLCYWCITEPEIQKFTSKKMSISFHFWKTLRETREQCVCGADGWWFHRAGYKQLLWWLIEDCTWDLLSPLSTQECTCCLCQYPDALCVWCIYGNCQQCLLKVLAEECLISGTQHFKVTNLVFSWGLFVIIQFWEGVVLDFHCMLFNNLLYLLARAMNLDFQSAEIENMNETHHLQHAVMK